MPQQIFRFSANAFQTHPVYRFCAVIGLFLSMTVCTATSQSVLAQADSKDKPSNQAEQQGNQAEQQGDDKTDKPVPEYRFQKNPKAPSLEGGRGWLNTSGEITLKDLRGKIVLLDFWTFCCINCIHVLPDLKYLEEKFNKELVVIGVHSAKFDNEKQTENIRQAIMRYEIKHPVINDADMTIWRKFGSRSWPTLVLIDPEGRYCGYISGEGHREGLEAVIKYLITYHKAKGTLDASPVRFALESANAKPTPLKYPGKLLADEKSDRLYISDSNHNRIVITTLDGKWIDTIGTGEMGSEDGSYDQATFDHPQGLALVDDWLYVADTENHLIRTINLKANTVSTLAGTGKQARIRTRGGKLRETALNSPWALVPLKGVLYIAMAGPHQIWKHKLGSETVELFAGTGREDITNGSLNSSAFAQPSGITTDGKSLYLVDSEGSAVRKIELEPEGAGNVTTLAGPSDMERGRALFEFGDIDGQGETARLQHPLGIVYHNNNLFVADSYNHKIKKVDLDNQSVSAWLGSGKRGNTSDPLQFSEPSGLALAADTLYIADTNNHRILTVDLKTDQHGELKIAGLKPPVKKFSNSSIAVDQDEMIELPQQKQATGKSLAVVVQVKLPEEYKLNEQFPARFQILLPESQSLFKVKEDEDKTPKVTGKLKSDAKTGLLSATIPYAQTGVTGSATITLSASFGYCRGGEGGLCKLKTVQWEIPLAVEKDAKAKQLSISLEVKE